MRQIKDKQRMVALGVGFKITTDGLQENKNTISRKPLLYFVNPRNVQIYKVPHKVYAAIVYKKANSVEKKENES